ncbi:MAG: acetoacetate--CoA ligase [Gemmatimonadales bacterium]|nr:acetoacetate--CoA ligase [Gemmatimonadales bacterium]
MDAAMPQWIPNPTRVASSHLARFLAARRAEGIALPPHDDAEAFRALHAWSIADPAAFWAAVWHDADVVADQRPGGEAWDAVVVGLDRMAPPEPQRGPHWFAGAKLNFAENLLRHDGDHDAIVAWDERGALAPWSWRQLRETVARVTAGLAALGVGPGDRVAGWLPNIPETIVAMLATSALGAVWTSCSPDFGVEGIVDRFGQTTPRVLFFCDGYGYSGKVHDCVARAEELLPRLPSVEHAVMIPYRGAAILPDDPRMSTWAQLLGDGPTPPMRFTRLPFDHPLYILYSSGTTGLPKCMVHGAGGTLLQHLKEHRLHGDLHARERLFYFTTCGWMMWNWLVSGLAVGATLVLYDGAPMPSHDPAILWRLAAAERVQLFGTSAKYLALAEKAGLEPARDFALDALRTVFSTGSPLAAESFDWVTRAVGAVQVASISGGTDIVSCFVLGNPISPVYRGEIQGPGLGMAVEVFDAAGQPAPVGEAGELVCTRPFPSMPVAFWHDPDGALYRAAYFSEYPGVWRHGDWITRTVHGGFAISGRSDATLNPGGVRIGTAEIYRQVETIPEVLESLVIGQRIPGSADGDVRVVLFVRLVEGVSLDGALVDRLRKRIRDGASPHHVPRVVLAVRDIPRTRSGKLSELAVRDVVEGRPVKNVGALANPESLEEFRDRAELLQVQPPH